MDYLPLTGESAADRSRLEAQQRSASLQPGDVTTHWHSWIVHPLTGQEALTISNDADKEFLTAAELATVLSQEDAEAADWFLGVEGIQ